jgi:hypothetical protein
MTESAGTAHSDISYLPMLHSDQPVLLYNLPADLYASVL